MFLTIAYIVISLIIDGVIFYFTGLYQYPYFYWEPVLAFPIIYILLFGLTLLILLFHSLFVNKKKEFSKPNRYYNFIVGQVTHQINFLSGSIVKRTGFEKIPHDKPYLIIYNHTSNFDPMFIMDYLKKDKIICVTKPQNFDIPIAGAFVYKAGYIQINRENPKEGLRAINQAIEYAKEGYSIAIAPEGTRMKDGKLGPFHAGSLQVAYRAGLPIVICGFKNTNKIHSNFLKRFTKINMDILGVYNYEDYKDIATAILSEQIRQIYLTYLDQAEKKE